MTKRLLTALLALSLVLVGSIDDHRARAEELSFSADETGGDWEEGEGTLWWRDPSVTLESITEQILHDALIIEQSPLSDAVALTVDQLKIIPSQETLLQAIIEARQENDRILTQARIELDAQPTDPNDSVRKAVYQLIRDAAAQVTGRDRASDRPEVRKMAAILGAEDASFMDAMADLVRVKQSLNIPELAKETILAEQKIPAWVRETLFIESILLPLFQFELADTRRDDDTAERIREAFGKQVQNWRSLISSGRYLHSRPMNLAAFPSIEVIDRAHPDANIIARVLGSALPNLYRSFEQQILFPTDATMPAEGQVVRSFLTLAPSALVDHSQRLVNLSQPTITTLIWQGHQPDTAELVMEHSLKGPVLADTEPMIVTPHVETVYEFSSKAAASPAKPAKTSFTLKSATITAMPYESEPETDHHPARIYIDEHQQNRYHYDLHTGRSDTITVNRRRYRPGS